jgi:hypothetical protein
MILSSVGASSADAREAMVRPATIAMALGPAGDFGPLDGLADRAYPIHLDGFAERAVRACREWPLVTTQR